MSDSDTLFTGQDQFIVVLDSRNASQYLNSSFNSQVVFNLRSPIRKGDSTIKMSCAVFSFTCPNSMYNINEYNNQLNITISGVVNSYKFPYGNYNSQSFNSQLISLLGYSFSLNLNSTNNIFTLTNSTTDFTINPSSIWNIFGLQYKTTYNSTNKSFTCPFTCNFNGYQSINIHFANLNTNNIDSSYETNGNIIQSIGIDNTLQQIFYFRQTDFAFQVRQDTIDYIQIELKDDLENFINLNNQHFNLTLVFTKVKDFDRFDYKKDFNSILQYGNHLYN